MSTVDLLIRADAVPRSGAGHVMRTSVLAEAWIGSGAGRVGLVGTVAIDFVRRRLEELGMSRREKLPADARGAVLVVDSYEDTARREGAAWDGGALRVLVDDLGGDVPDGFDVVWNPNPFGAESLYPGFRGTVLSGAPWVPVRAGLPRWEGGEPRRVAVLLGGGRIEPGLTAAMAQLARALPGQTFTGAGEWVPPSWERLDPEHLWPDVVRASTLITAAGTSLLEAASTGVPVVGVCTADNQMRGAEWASQAGVPVVDSRPPTDARELATEVANALSSARPLPMVANGAPGVARRLLELVSERGALA